MSIERLPGGTAEDYKNHISTEIVKLAEIYSQMSSVSIASCHTAIINKIKCCLTDRAPVNHLTVFLLEKEWGTHLIELNCNVHPLEGISNRIRKEFQACEEKVLQRSGECIAWKLIMALNSLRFSDKYNHVMQMEEFMKSNDQKVTKIPWKSAARNFSIRWCLFLHFR